MSQSWCPTGGLCKTGRNSHKAFLTGCVRENRADGPSGHSCCWCRGIITKYIQLKAHVSWSCNHCIIHIFWITVGSVEYVQYNKCCMFFFWLGPGISLVAWQLLKRLTGVSWVSPVCSLTKEFQLDVGASWHGRGSKWCNSSWGGHECLGLISWQTI